MLTIEDLTVRYRTPGGEIEALSSISLAVAKGSTLALVGESGSGKSTVALAAMGLLPAEARVVDFGIRGLDLAYALQDGYENTILVDACPHGEAPGTLYVIEPDLEGLDDPEIPQAALEAHAMNPVSVLRMARAMNIEVKNVLLVGCEPETLGGEDGQMGLSAPVKAAVDHAVGLVESIIDKILKGDRFDSNPRSEL